MGVGVGGGDTVDRGGVIVGAGAFVCEGEGIGEGLGETGTEDEGEGDGVEGTVGSVGAGMFVAIGVAVLVIDGLTCVLVERPLLVDVYHRPIGTAARIMPTNKTRISVLEATNLDSK